MLKKNPKGAGSAASVSISDADLEAVRARAYELYVDRGMEDGHDLDDWFRAEQELAARKSQSAAA